MFLENSLFQKIIKSTPLISIDLIVIDNEEKVLLGKRINSPARGFWFVPGGRILKDETLSDAFTRITISELNNKFNLQEAKFLGVYEHFYDDNFFSNEFSTHYIVLGYCIKLNSISLDLPTKQHGCFNWFSIAELLGDKNIHQNTKSYFLNRE